jgi:subtilisin family serine protease/subtilisin-like proprotein convertase family protein
MSLLASLSLLSPVFAQNSATAPFFYSGGKKNQLGDSTRWTAIRVTDDTTANSAITAARSQTAFDPNRSVMRLRRRNIVVLPVKPGTNANTRQQLRSTVGRARGVKRALRVFGTANYPIVETEQFVVQFKPGVSRAQAEQMLLKRGAYIISSLGKYAPNGYLAQVANTDATSATTAANSLYESGQTKFSHPNFLWARQTRHIPNDPLYPAQWHLNNPAGPAHIRAQAAWDITRGNSNLTVAVIDEGIDINHPDLKAHMVPGYDFYDRDADPRPAGPLENHGTEVAGVVAAVGNNGIGVSGIAPNAKIMPIRLVGERAANDMTGPQDEADAFAFAADNGADIINCSWGPPDEWPPSLEVLPDVVRASIEYAATSGRGGKGCVIFFAAGNGYESADTDGYASNPHVISVAASTSEDNHAGYSDFGSSVDISAPSNGGDLSITTTDRSGDDGDDPYSDYYSYFGGTSAASPLAAGVAALVLSLEPNLTRLQVQQRLQNTADKVGGVTYASNGHNIQMGYGRINAERALMAATGAYSVSGRVTLSNGTGVSGITVTASSTGGTTTTDSNGNYTLPRVTAGTTTITPSRESYIVSPVSRTITLSSNTTGIDFIASPLTTTLLNPASDTTISGLTTLRASTNNDSAVQRVDFARRVHPFSFERSPNLPIADNSTVTDTQNLTAPNGAVSATVNVHINHGYIGDLVVTLIAPNGSRKVLHERTGTGEILVKNYEVTLDNTGISGAWKLEVKDQDTEKTGTLVSWGMSITPAWVAIASDDNGATDGAWTASWEAAPVGLYDFKATAVAGSVTHSDINTSVTIGNAVRTLSGRVLSETGNGVPGVTVTRSGSTLTVITDAQGRYSFSEIPSGTYTVTPSLVGSVFSPTSKSVTVGTASVADVNFVEIPIIRIITPAANATYSSLGSVTGTVTASSVISISQVKVYLYRYGQDATGATPAVPAGYWAGGDTWTTTYSESANLRLATGTANWSLPLPASLPAGRYRVRATAYDSAGNATLSDMVSFYIQNAVLQVKVTTPVANARYASLANATGTASDGGSGSVISQVKAYLYRYGQDAVGTSPAIPAGYWAGGTNWTTTYSDAGNLLPASGKTSWSLALPASLPAGRYRVKATVFGTNGKTAVSDMISFYIESTVLSVKVTTPVANARYESLSMASGTASDGGSGSAIAQVRINLFRYGQDAMGTSPAIPAGYWAGGTNWTTTYTDAANLLLATGKSSWSFTLPASLDSGRYRIKATVFGTNGKTAVSDMISFYIDRTVLTVKVTTPTASGRYASLGAATGTASDGGSGAAIAQVKAYLFRYGQDASGTSPAIPAGYWAGGTNWTTTYSDAANLRLATGKTSWSLALPATLPAGRYRVKATVYGTNGKTAVSDMVSFYIDSASTQVRNTPATSRVVLSTATVDRHSGILLTFTGALDANTATDVNRYVIERNGVFIDIESATLTANRTSVLLGFPEGRLQQGDILRVSWQGLRDFNGSLIESRRVQVNIR